MPDQKQSILIGAVVTLVLSTSYLSLINCLCCAGYILGGLAAVWHYTDSNKLTIETGRGAMLGMMAVVAGALVAIFVNYLLIAAGLPNPNEVMSGYMMEQFGDQMSAEQMEQMRDSQTERLSFVSYFLRGLVGVVVGAIFGAIGGAIGAATFKKGGSGGERAETAPASPAV